MEEPSFMSRAATVIAITEDIFNRMAFDSQAQRACGTGIALAGKQSHTIQSLGYILISRFINPGVAIPPVQIKIVRTQIVRQQILTLEGKLAIHMGLDFISVSHRHFPPLSNTSASTLRT